MGLFEGDATSRLNRLCTGSGHDIAAVRVKQRVMFSRADTAAGARACSGKMGRGAQTIRAYIVLLYQFCPLADVQVLELRTVVQIVSLTTFLTRLLRLAGTGTVGYRVGCLLRRRCEGDCC